MANFDDIFNASQSVKTEDKSYSSFDKEEWAAQKKQEREDAYAKIDETAGRMCFLWDTFAGVPLVMSGYFSCIYS